MSSRSRHPRPLRSGEDLPAFDRNKGILHAIVDIPKGSLNKFKLDDELGLYKLSESFRRARPSRSTSGSFLRPSERTAIRSTSCC